MKRLIIILTLCIIVIIAILVKNNYEGLCGNYTLTYSKVKDIFDNSDITGIKQSFNTHYKRDLLTQCY